MNITEKVAYIKGLIDGLEIDKTTKEGKVLLALVDAVEDIAFTVADHSDQIDAIDEDLDTLEEYVYTDDDDLYDDDDDYCFGCDGCDDEDFDESEYEFECPNCHETVYLDESVLEDGKPITCPSCGTKLEAYTEEEEESED